ncbi:N-acetylglucosaminyl-phosphatidylinositol de-N-acetylase [Chionoecetes opilio]|uniref:N-acetylglucosaminylphosphatidylinositol deacetylase n=1 Tax=Chionoecetes opilio TaxID=41210 RepID=A0A8J4XQL7_CHIOP|nr:N-acetylglucosaminyl-phosphatidylinositol de-N-acetylase [Chionoecetes opilio]
MIVTAHPDDEVMFFGPTILHFTGREDTLVYLVCMSTGNYYGHGRTRGQELLASCGVLGVAVDNVYLYRCDAMPDHPDVLWPTQRTANIINHHIHALDVDMVVTFDSGGTWDGRQPLRLVFRLAPLVEPSTATQYVLNGYREFRCEAYSLDTVGLVRKYSSLLDVPLSYSMSSCAFTTDRKNHSILQVCVCVCVCVCVVGPPSLGKVSFSRVRIRNSHFSFF